MANDETNKKCSETKSTGKPNLPRLTWTSVPTVHGKSSNIPSESGIYAYGEVRRVGGLPVATTWVYIGKSKNLKTRISAGHDHRREANRPLKHWITRTKGGVELWFAPVAEADLDRVESHLVSTIKPTFNVNLKN